MNLKLPLKTVGWDPPEDPEDERLIKPPVPSLLLLSSFLPSPHHPSVCDQSFAHHFHFTSCPRDRPSFVHSLIHSFFLSLRASTFFENRITAPSPATISKPANKAPKTPILHLGRYLHINQSILLFQSSILIDSRQK